MDFRDVQRQLRDSPIAFVTADVPADVLTPAAILMRLNSDGRGPAFLLESVDRGQSVGRYSFVGSAPTEEIVLFQDGGWHRIGSRRHRITSGDLPALLRSRLPARSIPKGVAPAIGLTGGWVGYFAYDVIRLWERLPSRAPDVLQQPWIHLGLYDRIVAVDHVCQTARAIAAVRPADSSRPGAVRAYEQSRRGLDRLVRCLGCPLTVSPLPPQAESVARSNMSRQEFSAAVAAMKSHIRRGDIFQGVLSQRWRVPSPRDAFAVYRRLRQSNPSPYMFFLRCDDLAIAGSSPETLIQKNGNVVTTRPIAGTRPRGANLAEDLRREEQLRKSPKENAEHLMLVDLGRNDLGRVCRFGTVRTEPFRDIERFSHVLHMVSTVRGRIRPRIDAFDALAAAFPAGTLTGAPKIRAMEIIDALEPSRRGVYGGCVGYFDWGGNMDMAIAIRTVVMDKNAAYVQAGAGIVADSDADREFAETCSKAAAPLAAAGGVWNTKERR
ncbi:MAG: chorismate-binding protein [Candidatus Zixiibacteriota bacterium]